MSGGEGQPCGGGGAGRAGETTLGGQPRKTGTIACLPQPLPSQGSSPELSLHLVGTRMRGPRLPPSVASEAAKLERGTPSKAGLGLNRSCTHPRADCAPGRPGRGGG